MNQFICATKRHRSRLESAALRNASLGFSATGNSLEGETLSVAATGGGTATAITFGVLSGQVSTLNQLNAALAANNLQATVNSGQINIVTANDAESSTIGAITGSATAAGQAFNGLTIAGPVVDPNSQSQRAGLVSQYNNVLSQIDSTTQDALFNGVSPPLQSSQRAAASTRRSRTSAS